MEFAKEGHTLSEEVNMQNIQTDIVESFAMSAKKHEIPYEEVVHAILLARFVKSSSVFGESMAALKLLKKDK